MVREDVTRSAIYGVLALLVTAGTALAGRAYIAYLRATPFPSERALAVPYVWLLGALVGLALALQTLRFGPWNRHAAPVLALSLIGVLLALPNIALAALYVIGEMLGD